MEVINLINEIVSRLQTVRGVTGIVLGGSRAKGTHTVSSDIDIGIYYEDALQLDLPAIGQVATELDDERRAAITTPIGEWGPWINSGGWLRIGGYPVDFLYRDLWKVEEVVHACCKGSITIDYQPGHAHGFVNAIYMGEIAHCKLLSDPHGKLAELKSKTVSYPPLLKKAMIERFLWEASFSLVFTSKSISRIDVSHAAGYCFRAVSCLNQVLFAQNEQYWINETGAVDSIDRFTQVPVNYKQRVNRVFAMLDSDAAQMREAVELLRGLVEETGTIVRS